MLMEETKKMFFLTEEEAEQKVEELKQTEGAQLVDYKISVKQKKEDSYIVLTTKLRFATLTEAQEAHGIG